MRDWTYNKDTKRDNDSPDFWRHVGMVYALIMTNPEGGRAHAILKHLIFHERMAKWGDPHWAGHEVAPSVHVNDVLMRIGHIGSFCPTSTSPLHCFTSSLVLTHLLLTLENLGVYSRYY